MWTEKVLELATPYSTQHNAYKYMLTQINQFTGQVFHLPHIPFSMFTLTMSTQLFLPHSVLLSFCISFIVMTYSASHMLGNETDRVALLAFKSKMSPDSQRVLTSWNTSSHFCEWEGVTCGRRHRRVTELSLASSELTGSISPHIGNLSFLRTLDLYQNMLKGQIPQEVGRLLRLEYLNLTYNSLSGALPVNLSHCINLVTLNLGRNELVGRIPESYGSFPKLAWFDLRDNSLTGGIPVSFGNLSSMYRFQASTNKLTGSIPESFSQLTKLEIIVLSGNMLSGMFPPSLFNISSMKFIYLPHNYLEGNLPQDIGVKLPNLRSLLIARNQFSGSLPISLFTNTSQLEMLDLVVNMFSGAIPVEVGQQKSLVHFRLGGNSFGSGGKVDDLGFLTSLNNCTNLQILSVAYNNLGGMLPVSITNLSTQLNTLYLGENKIFGGIPLDIGKLNNLSSLSLTANSLTGVIPTSIGMLQKLEGLQVDENNLHGEIPHSMGNMSSLFHLDLSKNILEGSILTNFENIRLLQYLYLGHNRLTGTIPKQLFMVHRQLLEINLSNNFFVGPLPLEVGKLESVLTFDLSGNRISGPIPNTLGNCLTLQELYLRGNLFHGEIPPSFQNLKSIKKIDLSQNNLSGQIFKDLAKLPYLEWLNLSFNNLEGEVPIEGIFRNTSAFSLVGNDMVCGGITKLHLPHCHIRKPKKKGMNLGAKLTLGAMLLSSFVIASLLIVLYSRKSSSSNPITKEIGNKLPRISYKELYDATSGFSSEMLIGVGSYGSVFKGVLHRYESVIAVKVFNLMARGASKNFIAECETLRKVRHRNLLKIFTVCSSVDYNGNDFKALVFEFMSYGSLESWLHPTSNGKYPSRNLSFLQRLNIAIDIAFALDYLHNHFGTPIVHCDLKPTNVLLSENMVACLGDFGLAKFLTKNFTNSGTTEESISNSIRGTIGYIPPEYGMGVDVSMKGDVYSYGILILEMFTGKRPTDPMFNNSTTLHSFCDQTEQVLNILDTRMLLEETPAESFHDDNEEQQHFPNRVLGCLILIMKVGVACSSEVIADRMNIADVVNELLAIKEIFMKDGEMTEM